MCVSLLGFVLMFMCCNVSTVVFVALLVVWWYCFGYCRVSVLVSGSFLLSSFLASMTGVLLLVIMYLTCCRISVMVFVMTLLVIVLFVVLNVSGVNVVSLIGCCVHIYCINLPRCVLCYDLVLLVDGSGFIRVSISVASVADLLRLLTLVVVVCIILCLI